MNTKKGSLEQWQELGELTRETYNKLVDICIRADKIMPQKDWQNASKAQAALAKFRSHAEEVMFKQLGEEGGARIDIFYSRDGDGFYRVR